MKLRVIGTKDECALAQEYYNSLRGKENVKYVCVSGFYSCRGSADLFRVYIEVAYFDTVEQQTKSLLSGRGGRK